MSLQVQCDDVGCRHCRAMLCDRQILVMKKTASGSVECTCQTIDKFINKKRRRIS